jgi:endonuclease G
MEAIMTAIANRSLGPARSVFVLSLLLAGCAGPVSRVGPSPESPAAGGDAPVPTWPVAVDESPLPHVVFGEPVYFEDDPGHNMTLRYGAFSAYYDDRVLGPRWAAMKLTTAVADANSDFARPDRFKTDPALEESGLDFTTHDDYANTPDRPRKWDRGHMVQFDDVRGYGDDAGRDSMFTTNVCPQLAALNQRGWLTLEERMTDCARDFGTVWLIIGPVYDSPPHPFEPGRRVPAADAFFRIAVRSGAAGDPLVIAFIMPQAPVSRDAELEAFQVSIDEIEARTGLDFFHDLPDEIEDAVEAEVPTIWPDLP